MKRRTILKSAAVAAGAVVLGISSKSLARTGARLELTKTYGPDTRPYQLVRAVIQLKPGDARSRLVEQRPRCFAPHSNLVDRFEEAIKFAQEFSQATPVLNDAKLQFEFYKADGEPWLPDPFDPHVSVPLTCEAYQIFVNQRWTIIDRAVVLRMNAAWREHDAPLTYGVDDPDEIMARGLRHKEWAPRQRDDLARVDISYKVHTGTRVTDEILDSAGWR